MKFFCTLLWIFAVNCQLYARDWSFLPDYLGEINGVKISRADFAREMDAQFSSAILQRQVPDQLLRNVAPKMVKGFIDREVLLVLAAEDGFSADIRSARELMRKKLLSLPKAKALRMARNLKSQNMTLDEYIRKSLDNQFLRNNFIIKCWISKKIMPKISVSDAEIQECYKENQRKFITPGDPANTIRVSHILIRPKNDSPGEQKKARKKATIIAMRLKNGESFQKLAARHSDCLTGKYDKGSLGIIRRDQMPKQFSDAAFELASGDISKVVKTTMGFHIIRRDPSLFPKVRTLSDVRKAVRAMAKKQKSEKKINALIEKAKRRLDVKVYYIPPTQAKTQK